MTVALRVGTAIDHEGAPHRAIAARAEVLRDGTVLELLLWEVACVSCRTPVRYRTTATVWSPIGNRCRRCARCGLPALPGDAV